MRYLRRLCIIVLLLCIMINKGYVLAMGTGFTTKELTAEEAQRIILEIQITKVIDELPKRKIVCFDVSYKNSIALGFGESDRKTIGVYTDKGEFLYGYRFNCIGKFGLEWENDNLIIYFVRSDIALAVDPNGEVVSIHEIENSTENNIYWNNHVFATERIVDDTKYIIQNDMGIFNLFASSYTQLVILKMDGTEDIIYDVNDGQYLMSIIISVVVALFISISLLAILKAKKI